MFDKDKSIILTGFCIKCKNKVLLKNPILEGTPTGRNTIKGNCAICNTKVCKFVSSDFNQIDLQKSILKTEKETEARKKEDEKKKVDEFVKNSKENPILKKNGIIPIRRGYYNLIKFALFLVTVLVCILLFRTIYPEDFVPLNDNINLTCGNNNCSCPPCPAMNCSLVCGACIIDEIDINLNDTG